MGHAATQVGLLSMDVVVLDVETQATDAGSHSRGLKHLVPVSRNVAGLECHAPIRRADYSSCGSKTRCYNARPRVGR
jgi:hypothetical protein